MNKYFFLILFFLTLYTLYKYYKKLYNYINKNNIDIIYDIIKNNHQDIKKKSIIKKNNKSIINNIDNEDYTLTETTNNIINNIYEDKLQNLLVSSVFLDIEINNKHIGRIIINLYNDIVPITVNNFINLIKYKFKKSLFHRIVKNFCIQGGDYIDGSGNNNESYNGGLFDDENFILKHNKPYMVSMANSGKNTNGSQFFITTNITEDLNNKHVVFGIIDDYESINVINKLNDEIVDTNDKPINNIIIYNCGVL